VIGLGEHPLLVPDDKNPSEEDQHRPEYEQAQERHFLHITP
jgi:hypothetical protein